MEDPLRSQVPQILEKARRHLGKPYDINYRFDDEKIYCSELLFVAIKEATGREIGKVEKFGDLNWEPHEDFILTIEETVPMDREMITPVSLASAPELRKIYPRGD